MSKRRPVPCGWLTYPVGPCGERREPLATVIAGVRYRAELRAESERQRRIESADRAILAAFRRSASGIGWDANGSPEEEDDRPETRTPPVRRVRRMAPLSLAVAIAALASSPGRR